MTNILNRLLRNIINDEFKDHNYNVDFNVYLILTLTVRNLSFFSFGTQVTMITSRLLLNANGIGKTTAHKTLVISTLRNRSQSFYYQELYTSNTTTMFTTPANVKGNNNSTRKTNRHNLKNLNNRSTITYLLARLRRHVTSFNYLTFNLTMFSKATLVSNKIIRTRISLNGMQHISIGNRIGIMVRIMTQQVMTLTFTIFNLTVSLNTVLISVRVTTRCLQRLSSIKVNITPTTLQDGSRRTHIFIRRSINTPNERHTHKIRQNRTLNVNLTMNRLLTSVIHNTKAVTTGRKKRLTSTLFTRMTFISLNLPRGSRLNATGHTLFLLRRLIGRTRNYLPSANDIYRF